MKDGEETFNTHATKAAELLSEYNCHKQYSACLTLYEKFYEGIKKNYDKKTKKRNNGRISKLKKDRKKKMNELESKYKDTHHFVDVHLKDLEEYRKSINDSFNNDNPVETMRGLYIDLRRGSEKPYVSVAQSVHYDTTNGIFVVAGDFNNTGVIKDLNLQEVMEQEAHEGRLY